MYLNIISNKELNKRIVAQINNDVELEMSAARYLGNLLIDVLNDPTGLKNWVDSEEHQKFKQTYKGDTCSAVKIYDEYRDKLDELLGFYTRTEIGAYLFHIFLTTKDNGNDVLLVKENTMVSAIVNKANLQAFAKFAKKQGTLKSRLLKARVLEYISSPMNYIGGKAKLLPQLIPLFPTEINTLYDVFTGGGNIIANVSAKSYKANDLNDFVIGILDTFYRKDINNILSEIDAIINKYSLSKENADGFLRLRSDYNSNKSPLMLYTLICYSFNYQFRFNNNLDYNTPFGCNKSHFSDKLRERLISFIERLQMRDISFSSQHFDDFLLNQNFKAGDFVYLDPPYLITTGNYNDGNRGFKDWTNDEENRLYEVLEHLDKNGVKWALSNVIEHKGKKNQLLLDFSQHYNLHYLNYSYANSSHNTNRSSSKEILLTNY